MHEDPGGGLAELVLRMAETKATAASLPRVDLHRDPRLDCPSEALSTLRNPQDEALAECHLERDRVSEPAHELLGPMNTEAVVLSVAVPDSREQAAAGFAEPQQAAGKARRGTLPLLTTLVLMGISAAWLMLSSEKLRFPDPSSVGFTGGTTQSGTRTKNSSLASASSASATPLPAVLFGESINIAQ